MGKSSKFKKTRHLERKEVLDSNPRNDSLLHCNKVFLKKKVNLIFRNFKHFDLNIMNKPSPKLSFQHFFFKLFETY